MTSPQRQPAAVGFLYAVLAYASWGIFPLYWKLFVGVSALEVICHRVIWSLVLFAIFVVAFRQVGEVLAVLRDIKRVAILFLTASLLSVNWGLFIYGVVTARVVQTSLGYFITPLISIFLGFVFLKERLDRWQTAAVLLAGAGVLHFGFHLGRMPWIALGLGISFGLYGLLRKVVPVTPLVGMFVETVLMAPFALLVIWIMWSQGATVFGKSPDMTLLFLGGGVATTLPLLCFNSAAKMLPLSTLGFLHYITPTLQLLVGVAAFHEVFTFREGFSFLLIWIAIAIYLWTLLREKKVPVVSEIP